MPNLINKEKIIAEEILRESGFNVKLVGEGSIVRDQLPKAGSTVNKNSTVWLFDADDAETYNIFIPVPDFRGLKAAEAAALADKKGLKLSLSGSGKVIGQSVYPGRRIKSDKVISLKLR